MQSPTPHGPWSTPRLSQDPFDPTHGNLRDFDLGVGPDRDAWMAKSHGDVVLYRLNDERDGIVKMVEAGADTSMFGGGIGVHHQESLPLVSHHRACTEFASHFRVRAGARQRVESDQSRRRNKAARAWPPPMHIVTMPSSPPVRRRCLTTRNDRIAPVAPTG